MSSKFQDVQSSFFQGMVAKLICLPRLSAPSQFGPSLTPLGFLLKCPLTSKASLARLPSSTLLCALASLRSSYHHPPFILTFYTRPSLRLLQRVSPMRAEVRQFDSLLCTQCLGKVPTKSFHLNLTKILEV